MFFCYPSPPKPYQTGTGERREELRVGSLNNVRGKECPACGSTRGTPNRLLPLAEATLLGRIAAARRSAVASRAGVARGRGGDLATALAGFASAAGAGAAIVHCIVHRKLLFGWLGSADIGCPMRGRS